MFHEGDRIRFTHEGNRLEGLVIQVHPTEATVKLDSGYNLILPIKGFADVEKLPEKAGRPAPKREERIRHDLPRVSILHTGGTIASKVDYKTGAVVAQFDPAELVTMFPELLDLANIESHLIRNMQSDDMRFAHYNLIGRAVMEEIRKDVKGVIITHGTDTLHYTAAALSFLLEGLNLPVVLVGSQRSSDRGSSDAPSNLLGALTFILEGKMPGVFVAMHESPSDATIAIHSGLHVRKNHSSRRDAFASVNSPLFARVRDGQVEILDTDRAALLKRNASDRPQMLPFREDLRVGWWKVHPQSWVEELKAYDLFHGLLVEGTGLGHAPITGIDEFTREQHPFIREKIAHLAQRIPVVMATQTLWGRVDMDVYSPGRTLQEAGVLGQGLDMPPEVAFIKLAWCLSTFKGEDVKTKYAENLRGEISERSSI